MSIATKPRAPRKPRNVTTAPESTTAPENGPENVTIGVAPENGPENVTTTGESTNTTAPENVTTTTESTTAPENVTAPESTTGESTTAPVLGATLQDALNGIAPTRTESTTTGDANTVEFLSVVAELDAMIRAQSRTFVEYMAKRGAACRRAINVKMLKARSKDSRATLRAAALTVLENTALAAYDPSTEQKPKIDRWLKLDVVTCAYPAALKLASVAACEALSVLFTRVDPPRSWDAPEEHELKRQYRDKGDAIDAMIGRAVSENWTAQQVSDGIDAINGACEADPIKPKEEADPIKAARALAIKIMESIIATTVDAETLFDELQAQLTKYGWALAPGRSANGAETLKPIKRTR